MLVEHRSLHVVRSLDCCPLGDGYDAVDGFGATWTTDWSTGTVVRWNSQTYQIDATIHVAEPPFFGGLCLTSIAAGARAVWVTVGPLLDYRCDR